MDVACRTLGFATGAQLLAGSRSGLPGFDGTAATNVQLACNGDDATLADCTTNAPEPYDYDEENVRDEDAVVLLCFNPSGVDVARACCKNCPCMCNISAAPGLYFVV